jgi:hypothetical protein
MYNKRTWLAKNDISSTASIVCFDGQTKWKDKYIQNSFIEISSCSESIRLHKTDDETNEDFILKLQKINDDLQNYINYLKSETK